MIIFIYGQEQYLAKKQLEDIKTRFIQKYGDIAYDSYDYLEKKFTFEELVRSLYALPFLGGKRLVVIKNLISQSGTILQEKLIKMMKTSKIDADIIFYENTVPKKVNMFYKFLAKNSQVKEFAKLTLASKNQIINELIANKIADKKYHSIIFAKLSNSPKDLFYIENEIEKISLFLHDNSKIDIKEDLEILISDKTEENIFAFTDALGYKNTKLALGKLANLLSSGINEFYIMTMIAFELKNLLIIKDVMDNAGVKNSYEIAKLTKQNSFVVGKNLPKVRLFKLDELKLDYKLLLETDINIKNGKMNSRRAIEMLVVKICNN